MSSPSTNIEDTWGTLFISLLFSAVLFGLTNIQASMFFYANPRDPIGHKITVAWLWLLNLFYLIFVARYLYINLVSEPELSSQGRILWESKAMSLIEALTISTVHFLYTLRIWKIIWIKNKIFPFILIFLVSLTFAFGLLMFSKLCGVQGFAELGHIKWSLLMSFGSTSFTDIIISVSLIYILAQYRTGFAWTDSVITMLCSYALNTGVISSILSLAAFISLARFQGSGSIVFEGLRIVQSIVHINSFIAMLNSRHYFQSRNTRTILLQAHDAPINLSRFGDVHGTARNSAHSEMGTTMNNAGLPLFSTENGARCTHQKVIEVEVAKECSSSM